MARRFSLYPRTWKRSAPDANIDHRRVPNLRVFFSRKGESLAVTKDAKDYLPGDLVTWSLPGNLPHIGLVVDSKGQSGRNQIVHDVGRGPKLEDVLFEWEITGHLPLRRAPPVAAAPSVARAAVRPGVQRAQLDHLKVADLDRVERVRVRSRRLASALHHPRARV